MKRIEMIKDKKRFNFIIRKGKYKKDKYLVIYYVDNQENEFSHFGIAIKSNIGHAVVRNKLKRQIRTIVDKNKKLFKKDEDYIIMIRNECLNASFGVLEESLNTLLKGIKINEEK